MANKVRFRVTKRTLPLLRPILARIWIEFTDGKTFEDIAADMEGWNAQSLRRLAHAVGMPIGLGRGVRCLTISLDHRTIRNLDGIASQSDRDRKEIASDIMRFSLEGDGRKAVRLLGKTATPRKQGIQKHAK